MKNLLYLFFICLSPVLFTACGDPEGLAEIQGENTNILKSEEPEYEEPEYEEPGEELAEQQEAVPELNVEPPEDIEPDTVQFWVKYICDGGRSYILYEPGITNPNYVCELDAGHTAQPADWNATVNSSYCRVELDRLIAQYNCVEES